MMKYMIGKDSDFSIRNDRVIIIKSWAHTHTILPKWLVSALLRNVFEKTKEKVQSEIKLFCWYKTKGTKSSHYFCVTEIWHHCSLYTCFSTSYSILISNPNSTHHANYTLHTHTISYFLFLLNIYAHSFILIKSCTHIKYILYLNLITIQIPMKMKKKSKI